MVSRETEKFLIKRDDFGFGFALREIREIKREVFGFGFELKD